jgi:hypothetical protein
LADRNELFGHLPHVANDFSECCNAPPWCLNGLKLAARIGASCDRQSIDRLARPSDESSENKPAIEGAAIVADAAIGRRMGQRNKQQRKRKVDPS